MEEVLLELENDEDDQDTFFQRCPELKMYHTYSLTKKLARLSTSNSSSNSSHLKNGIN